MYESVGEFGRKIGSCKLCLMCQEKEKKNTEKRHMKKKMVKEKKSEKKEKFKSKECVRCGENRSIGENEGKRGQQDDICPKFLFVYMLY